ncbi:lipase [Clathrospora elynae]|uniref:Lipase n=1 Tax=Clathrospora elynae TaxID=706981 RepID=A0A6A5T2V1_9PLEO|nr:lipase [Clathrospora elynae]
MSTNPIPYSQAAQLDPRVTLPCPVIDPTLAPILDAFSIPEELDLRLMRGELDALPDVDPNDNPYVYNAFTITKANPKFEHSEHSTPGPDSTTVILSVFAPRKATSTALPAFYHVHGGGMVSGDRFVGLTEVLKSLDGIECVVISTSKNAAILGIDPARIVVYGLSGGEALAAATCLMARDRKGPAFPIMALMLHTPMLDNRCESVSDQQFEYSSPWCGVTNRKAWEHVLGAEHCGGDMITAYQAPSRAEDFSNLPSPYIDVGECEVFRDPAVMYATNMWRCGSTCELHVWPGGWHLFDMMDEAMSPLVQAAVAAKRAWLARMMQPKGEDDA